MPVVRNESAVSLVGQLESSITRCFYGKEAVAERQLPYAVGLQSPLWMWTHHASDDAEQKEIQRALCLVGWFLRNDVNPSTVAVILPLELKARFKSQLDKEARRQYEGERQRPVVLAHHELTAMNHRDKTQYTYDVVIYLFALSPDLQHLPRLMSQELFLHDALVAARRSFIISVDAGWMASTFTTKWPQWKNFVLKFQEEQPPISSDLADAGVLGRFPSMVGSSLPLCCAKHPCQRQLESGVTPIEPVCKHFCLCAYDCGLAEHLCTQTCHPSQKHVRCPFACHKTMPCGHECLMLCSNRCNCLQVIEKPLPCFHHIVLGLNKETLCPIYGVVQHVFKGVCADADLPCSVEYATECSRCLGGMTVKCFEAQEQQHTLENKTMLCEKCVRLQRELHCQILGEVLYGVEEDKKKLKIELERTLHQQRKAATQGLFKPGARVEIIDATKCVPPLLAEDDFPGIVFADMDDPDFYQRMEGAYGTFVSNHVDVMDRAEVRNLVRLPDGSHVLITDGGLRMIRALTSNVLGGPSLMLTYKAEQGALPNGTADNGSAAEFATALAMVGGWFYLSQPVCCAGLEQGTVTDKVVKVTGIDPSSPQHVMVECEQYGVALSSLEGQSANGVLEEEPASKRPRSETDTDGQLGTAACCSWGLTLLAFPAPIAVLEPLTGYEAGRYVFVMDHARQLANPHDMQLMQHMVRNMERLSLPKATLTTAPMDKDTPYLLVGIVNPPANLEHTNVGPCALLRRRPRRAVIRVNGERTRQRRKLGNNAHVQIRTLDVPLEDDENAPLVAIPFVFTLADELTEAERALDAAAQQVFDRRLQEVILQKSEAMAIRNDEEMFHAQQQMPEVTEEILRRPRHALSIPIPLPTAEGIAEARTRHVSLQPASSMSTRLLRSKDALITKQERLLGEKWAADMQERLRKEATSTIQYVRSMSRKLQKRY